jgi:hypothetical protein
VQSQQKRQYGVLPSAESRSVVFLLWASLPHGGAAVKFAHQHDAENSHARKYIIYRIASSAKYYAEAAAVSGDFPP